MKQLTTLAWKEWHEARIYLWIGLSIFLGLPIVGTLEQAITTSHRFEIQTTFWVIPFGGVLAVFVAVGSTCRDLTGKIEDFWQSRPVSVARWLLTKYFVGLAVVLVVCTVPLIAEIFTSREKAEVIATLTTFPFLWIAVYSIAFAAGCLLRRTAHAAMIGIVAVLLEWLLPAILPPLAWMNATNYDIENPVPLWGLRQLGFSAAMLGLAAAFAVLAIVSVHRSWRIDSGRRLIYGLISAAILLLLASATFNLKTNLPILQTIDIPKSESISDIHIENDRGYLETYRNTSSGSVYFHRSIDITAAGIRLGDPITVAGGYWRSGSRYYYQATRKIGTGDNDKPTGPLTLSIQHQLDDGSESPNVDVLTISSAKDLGNGGDCITWRNRLFVIYDFGSSAHITTLDITDPLKPVFLSDNPFSYNYYRHSVWGESPVSVSVQLYDLPGVPARDRLRLTLGGNWPLALEGDTYCTMTRDASGSHETPVAYHLSSLTDKAATFNKLGEYKRSFLETLFGVDLGWPNHLKNGLMYQPLTARGALRSSISVFDTRGPNPMRMVGHFAGPGARIVCPLADGRAVIGGDKLWLVAPPPTTN